MARTARKKSNSGVYHIVLRGINKQTLFYDDEDKEVLLNRIKLVKEKVDYDVYSFCFMSNHIHLLLREKEVSVGNIMRRIISSYVFWYNSKYERVGNLFQDRYNSEPIENDAYLLCAVRYIHQNPLRAGNVKSVDEYKWSSYSAYLNNARNIIEKNPVLSMLQGDEGYIEFMAETETNKFIEPTEHFKITDSKLIKKITTLLNIDNITQIYSFSRKEWDAIVKQVMQIEGGNPYQVSRVTGIPMGVIRTILA